MNRAKLPTITNNKELKKNNVICSSCMKLIEDAMDMIAVYNEEKGWNEIVHSKCVK